MGLRIPETRLDVFWISCFEFSEKAQGNSTKGAYAKHYYSEKFSKY
jgi:hypothetical protein